MIDKFNRRLNMMIVSNEKSKAEGAKGTFLNNLYSYDAAGNITGVTNSEALSAGIGGTMTHKYSYDDWYRLKTADGIFKSADETKSAKYSLLMGYDNLYNITSKKLTMSQTNLQFDGTLSAGHEFSYTYSDENPMQLASVETKQYNVDGKLADDKIDSELQKNQRTQNYKFDANGNMTSVSVDTVAPIKSFLWDEENRLLAVNNNGSVSCYFYDAAGERTVKLTSETEMVHVILLDILILIAIEERLVV